MVSITDRFTKLTELFASIDLFGGGPPSVPWGIGRRPDAAEVLAALGTGSSRLPRAYREGYADKLKNETPYLVAQLGLRIPPVVLETLAGAVYDHDPSRSVETELHRFLAIISDLFTSFISKQCRLVPNCGVVEHLAPLAMFQSRGHYGPFTIVGEVVERILGARVGVVSLPSAYRGHPILWMALAHETGGHDVSHASPSLLPELAREVERHFGGPYEYSPNPKPAELQALVWSYWIDQTAADIYGVLNAGPAFAMNVSALFAAMNARFDPARPKPYLRSRVGAGASGMLDPHPPDILRVALAIGVIENLHQLDPATRAAYVADLSAIEDLCAQGSTEIEIDGAVPVPHHAPVRVQARLPRAEWREAARSVGAMVTDVRLNTLGGHSVQEVETWNDTDENTTQAIRAALARGENVARAGDDAELMAAATLAVLDDIGAYDALTERVNQALDASFVDDPLWGLGLLDPMYTR